MALVGGLDSFPILCLMADLPIWMAKVISPEYWKWYGTIHAFLAQLRKVLYKGILATPSRIYIVINYIGGTAEKINRIPSSSAGDLLKRKSHKI